MLRRPFWLHLRNGLHLTLKNEESIVIEIDPSSLEERRHFGEVRRLAIDAATGQQGTRDAENSRVTG